MTKSIKKIRDTLQKGDKVMVKGRVEAYGSNYGVFKGARFYLEPDIVGTVHSVRVPVVRIIPGKRRPYDEFVCVRFRSDVVNYDDAMAAVSYDNIIIKEESNGFLRTEGVAFGGQGGGSRPGR